MENPDSSQSNQSLLGPPDDQYTWSSLIFSPLFEVLDAAPPYQRLAVKSLALIDQHQVDPILVLEGLARELPSAGRQEIWKLIAVYQPGDNLLVHLQQTRHVLPDGLAQAFILAEKNDSLTPIYQRILQRVGHFGRQNLIHHPSEYWLGALSKTFFVASVILFFMSKVVVEFRQLFIEFDLTDSKAMRWADLLTWWFSYVSLWLLPALILFMLLMVIIRFRSLLGYLYRFIPTHWTLRPIPKSMSRRQTLALMILAGRTVEDGILGINQSKGMKAFFARFDQIKESIKHQADGWQTLSKFRVITRQEATLLSDCSPQAQAWLLQWNASNFAKSREARRIIRGRGLIGLIQFFLLLLVFSICLIVFLAMIDLINELTKI